ncbi:MAG TPA: aspartate aminotransferase family protein [Nocardioides sp.]|uniref:aspartate aminotransferase family protein n=1 Tax=Nocardioides sp. TaxID=35761 RepID=UPI002F40458F
MAFDLAGLVAAHSGEGYELHGQHLNRQVPRMLHTIGFDTVYQHGEGCWVTADDGVRYLDLLAGFGVYGIGRNHPVVRHALQQALDAGFADLVQMDAPLLPGLLARELVARSPGMDRVFFCNSGTEAVEAALKFARAATGRTRIAYCEHAYHGVTVGSLSVNGGREFRAGFDPLLPDVSVPFGDLDALERELRSREVAALVVEPVQGKGVHVVPPGYLAAARELLHRYGALLICDEVQTGVGRTGTFLAYEQDDVQPDIVTVAKALSGGFVPVAATLARAWIFDRVYSSMDRAFVHASTFAGNALAMAAGLATLAVLDEEQLVANADRTGRLLTQRLQELATQEDLICDVRGRGLMVGIEFGQPRALRLRSQWTMLRAVRRGLFTQMVVGALYHRHRILTQVAGDHMEVLKLLPPLTIGEAEVDVFVDALADVIEQANRSSGWVWDFGRRLAQRAVTG